MGFTAAVYLDSGEKTIKNGFKRFYIFSLVIFYDNIILL